MTDLELMQFIKTKWGQLIADSCAMTAVPPAFLAALTANESGGDANAKRFEPALLHALWEILLGRKAAYGSISRSDLVSYVSGIAGTPVNAPSNLPADAFQRVDALATSWSLTQIMGYHILEWHKPIADVQDAPGNLDLAVKMLLGFAATFHLDAAANFEQLFRCWNGGHPTAATFDPQYVPHGLERMNLWNSLT